MPTMPVQQGVVTPAMEQEWSRMFPGLPTLEVSLDDETTVFHEGDETEDDPPIMLCEHALHMAAVLAVTTVSEGP